MMEDLATCRTCFKLQGIQNDWGTQRIVNGVDPKSTLSKVYNHVDKQGQRKIIYSEVCGSAVYAKKFLEHSELGTVTFDRLEEVFPELISGIYKDLVEAITKGPHKEKLLIRDDSGPNISVEQFLWREPSIFRVYDV
ncbi:uncharacterized protein LOC132056553 [Lycium ferocissimum]|uniref:uncharacterized protein LOC132056553 n=1 Tax=Lycium ferocissimum TaxID=112874 RepID=UPI0028150278|nr:uncharacterized protein LOC132056553 [Lycium ferocissimum]